MRHEGLLLLLSLLPLFPALTPISKIFTRGWGYSQYRWKVGVANKLTHALAVDIYNVRESVRLDISPPPPG